MFVVRPVSFWILILLWCSGAAAQPPAERDLMRDLQEEQIQSREEKRKRPYAFGWRGLSDVFSNHRYHSNRPVPVMTFGRFGDMGSIMDGASPYRDGESLAAIYGEECRETVSSDHTYGDQTQLHSLMLQAARDGAKRIIVLLMDGGDWQTYAAASIYSSGVHDQESMGRGLAFFDYTPPNEVPGRSMKSVGAVVTSPIHGRSPSGFNIEQGGRFPWSPQNSRYLAGEYAIGGTETSMKQAHAVTDSASSASSIFCGRKFRNGAINMDVEGNRIEPLGRTLQKKGWSVALVTDVPFDHASPAAVYGSVASRSQYQVLGRQLLGLEEYEGVDVSLGYGYQFPKFRGEPGELEYLAGEDLDQITNGTDYQVVTSDAGENVSEALLAAAKRVSSNRKGARRSHSRLFGFFGTQQLNHAPYRTANGDFEPSQGLDVRSGDPAPRESYDAATLARLPSLQTMTEAALEVLNADEDRPFLLFVEAGLVDWALHANNLDHAIGEVGSAEETFRHLVDWVTEQGGWEETLLLVTSDHGHLLQVDPELLRCRLLGHAPMPPVSKPLTKVAFASCANEERPQEFWEPIADDDPDLFLFMGDNVYADWREEKPLVVAEQISGDYLRESYSILGSRAEFQSFRSRVPILASWDDHDYGLNDGGQEFRLKETAKRSFLDFFCVPSDDPVRSRQGTYQSRVIGPPGKTTQILLLDTRWNRSSLKQTDERGARGKERYLPDADPEKAVLGDEQWAWLERELRTPADLRIVVSSIQILADSHGWEKWGNFPLERDRFFGLLKKTGARNVILLSGDRHVGGIYRSTELLEYPLFEVTSSSLNMAFSKVEDVVDETDPLLTAPLYGFQNYGIMEIDWDHYRVTLRLRNKEGKTVREEIVEIGG